MSSFQHQYQDTVGKFIYQDENVPRGLKTNGQIYVDIDPITSGFKEFVGINRIEKEMKVYNGRDLGMTIDNNGFTLVPTNFTNIDFTDDYDILNNYYPQVAELIKQSTGAFKVICFDHVVRHSEVSMAYEKRGNVVVGGPAVAVHGDYAQEGAPKRFENFTKPPGNNDSFRKLLGETPLISAEEYASLKNRRYAIINLWRNIADYPVYDTPLAMVDAATTEPNDIVTVEFRYVDCTIETYLAGHNPNHRWVYYPLLQKNEGILLKTFDSQGAIWNDSTYEPYHKDEPPIPASFAIHSAFTDNNAPSDAPKRQSCEVRTIVFF
mmetsp:Transcript_20462/g.22230  ORF Transcript_20462/g.22230 Transcript_20462/m.22230 type:complete len:322 (-) Transcript_20462:140-1105(-)